MSLPFAPGAAPRPMGVRPLRTPAACCALRVPCVKLAAGEAPKIAATASEIPTSTSTRARPKIDLRDMDILQAFAMEELESSPIARTVPIPAVQAVPEIEGHCKIETAERAAMFANCPKSRASGRADSQPKTPVKGARALPASPAPCPPALPGRGCAGPHHADRPEYKQPRADACLLWVVELMEWVRVVDLFGCYVRCTVEPEKSRDASRGASIQFCG